MSPADPPRYQLNDAPISFHMCLNNTRIPATICDPATYTTWYSRHPSNHPHKFQDRSHPVIQWCDGRIPSRKWLIYILFISPSTEIKLCLCCLSHFHLLSAADDDMEEEEQWQWQDGEWKEDDWDVLSLNTLYKVGIHRQTDRHLPPTAINILSSSMKSSWNTLSKWPK